MRTQVLSASIRSSSPSPSVSPRATVRAKSVVALEDEKPPAPSPSSSWTPAEVEMAASRKASPFTRPSATSFALPGRVSAACAVKVPSPFPSSGTALVPRAATRSSWPSKSRSPSCVRVELTIVA
jgi:hypothetical protein